MRDMCARRPRNFIRGKKRRDEQSVQDVATRSRHGKNETGEDIRQMSCRSASGLKQTWGGDSTQARSYREHKPKGKGSSMEGPLKEKQKTSRRGD